MEIVALKSKTVNQDSETFMLIVGHRHLNFGIQVHSWGLRLMLIWWHVCIRL